MPGGLPAHRHVRATPIPQSGQCRGEITPLVGQAVVVAHRPRLVWVLFQNSLLHQPFQPGRQQMPRDPEAGLELLEP